MLKGKRQAVDKQAAILFISTMARMTSNPAEYLWHLRTLMCKRVSELLPPPQLFNTQQIRLSHSSLFETTTCTGDSLLVPFSCSVSYRKLDETTLGHRGKTKTRIVSVHTTHMSLIYALTKSRFQTTSIRLPTCCSWRVGSHVGNHTVGRKGGKDRRKWKGGSVGKITGIHQ